MSLASGLVALPRKPGFTGLEAVDDTPEGGYLLALKFRAELCMAAGAWQQLAELGVPPSVGQDSLLVRAHRHYWAALAHAALGRVEEAREQRALLALAAAEVAQTPYLNRYAEMVSGLVRGAEAFSSLTGGRITPFVKDIAHMPGFALAPWMSKAGADGAAQAMMEEALKEHPNSQPLVRMADALKAKSNTTTNTVSAVSSASPASAETWPLPVPRGFALPDKSGATHQLSDFAGRPVLVIFFLGQGCAHCVEQLQKFRPLIGTYAEAGIPIVTIGTDSVTRLAGSLGAGPELDPELPYLVLSDESMSTFKAWHCYDEFLKKPLHGTFLLDGSGRMLWGDISHDPYSQPTFLLGECQRVLKAHGPPSTPPDQTAGK
jgi:peroxiredoxin